MTWGSGEAGSFSGAFIGNRRALREREGDSKAGIRPRVARMLRRRHRGVAPATIPLEHHPRLAWPSLAPVFIQGVTRDGQDLPPERLGRAPGRRDVVLPARRRRRRRGLIGYSPLCVPSDIGGVKCVLVSAELRDIEPMAWDFVMNFARDNDLRCRRRSPPSAAAEAHPAMRRNDKGLAARALRRARATAQAAWPAPSPWRPGGSCGAPPCSCGRCPCRPPSRSPAGPS